MEAFNEIFADYPLFKYSLKQLRLIMVQDSEGYQTPNDAFAQFRDSFTPVILLCHY